jgi:hypothetical protein
MQTEMMESKSVIKRIKMQEQDGLCTLSGKTLKKKQELNDAHLKVSKKHGGRVTKENVETTEPVAHMKFHGNLRLRDEDYDELKSIIDDRDQVRKLFNKINNQILAYKRKTDKLNEVTLNWLYGQLDPLKNELKLRDKALVKQVNKIAECSALTKAILGVPGIGPVTAAYCLTYIDFSKARHASCLWSYAGLHVPSHERYVKGVAGGGNKTLRTMLYTMAESQLKTRGAYRTVYDNMKARLEQSDKITTTKLSGGAMVQKPWKEVYPKHRHCASLRAMQKHFLADLWMIGRRYYELETTCLYPEAMLGGNHRTIQPEERGWVLDKTVSQE